MAGELMFGRQYYDRDSKNWSLVKMTEEESRSELLTCIDRLQVASNYFSAAGYFNIARDIQKQVDDLKEDMKNGFLS
jgi:hypothetical protein